MRGTVWGCGVVAMGIMGEREEDERGRLLDHVSLLAVSELESGKVAKQGHEPHQLVELQLSIRADDFVDADRMVR